MPTFRNRLAAGSIALAGLLTAGPASAAAQTDYYARAGLQYSSPLLKDQVIEPIEVRAGLAPMVAAGISVPMGAGTNVGVEGGLALTSLEAEDDLATRDLGSVTALSALLNLSGRVNGPLGWRAGLGVITYTGGDAGIFSDGGATQLLIGGGLDYRRPAFTGWDLMISARYDHHRFSTNELESRGFSGAQGVHRVSLGAGLTRGGR